jgi:hypothetical protein
LGDVAGDGEQAVLLLAGGEEHRAVLLELVQGRGELVEEPSRVSWLVGTAAR